MAVIRKGSAVSSRLNILLFGSKFSGKTSMALQAAYLKTPEGKPFKLLVFDTESGGTDEAIEELVSNGINADDILVVYTQSQSEIKSYIKKVANNEDFVEIDENGDEIYDKNGDPVVILDGEGKPFRPDCVIIDSISVLKITTQQSMLDLSRKRNKIKAEKANATAEEKFVAISNSGLELRDYNQMQYSAQDFVLSLMACGVHVIMTARETDEKISIKDSEGKTTSVATGKKIYDGLKGADYNCKTVIHMYNDEETGDICAHVEKDRTKVHSLGETIIDPSLLDYQVVIDGNRGKKNFVLKNDLDKAIETDKEIFEKQVVGVDLAQKSPDTSTEDIAALKTEIKTAISKLSPVEKKEMQGKLTAAGLPTAYTKVTDPETLAKILSIVAPN